MEFETMIPGDAQVCLGTVTHRRTTPAEHQFVYPIHQLWFDPDSPGDLTNQHWLWSHSRPAPARFRRSDYGVASDITLGQEVRSDLETVLGFEPSGAVRVVTQIRRWGWLFNPITLFLCWDQDEANPVGAVLEVTNTPWNERHRYPIRLAHQNNQYVARFPKTLHVSPFLDEDYDYKFSINDSVSNLSYRIDVVDKDDIVVVKTNAQMKRIPVTPSNLNKELLRAPMTTRQVSARIHIQAAKLLAKRVPFVSHPDKRKTETTGSA